MSSNDSTTHSTDNQRATDEDREAMRHLADRLAWLPFKLVEGEATRWAAIEGLIGVDDLPDRDPDLQPFEQLQAFQAWARDVVWPYWLEEQVKRAVPLVCPDWCTREHDEILGDGVILPWDLSAIHSSVDLAPDTQLDVRVLMTQSHPATGDNSEPTLFIGGDVDLALPVQVLAAADALAAAAPVLRAALDTYAEDGPANWVCDRCRAGWRGHDVEGRCR